MDISISGFPLSCMAWRLYQGEIYHVFGGVFPSTLLMKGRRGLRRLLPLYGVRWSFFLFDIR